MRRRLQIVFIVTLLCLIIASTSLFAQQTATAVYKNSQWQVVLDKNHNLSCFGAGHGSWGPNKRISIAQGVSDFWTAGSWRGPVIVFRKGNIYYATLRQYDSGRELASGKIYSGKDVHSINVDGRIYGAYIYVTLYNGKQTTWSIWQYPGFPGKVEKGATVTVEIPKEAPSEIPGTLKSTPADPKKFLGGRLSKVHFFNQDGRWVNLSGVAYDKSKVVICTNNKYSGTAEVFLWVTFYKPARFFITKYDYYTKEPNYGQYAKLDFIEFDREKLDKAAGKLGITKFLSVLKSAPYVYLLHIKAYDKGYHSAYTINFNAPCINAIGAAKIDDSKPVRAMIGSY